MNGRLDQFRREGEAHVALAHTTATFTRAKNLERLSHYLKPRDRVKTTWLDRMRAIKARQERPA